MYIHLIISALFPIYAGAHASLSRPSSAAKPDKKNKKTIDPEDEDEDEENVQKMEGLSNKDAIILPVTAAVVLAGLYFLIMKYGADMINLIMGWYFSGVGVYSVAKLVNDGAYLVIGFMFPTYYADRASLWKVDGNERKAIQQDEQDVKTRDIPMPSPFNFLPLPKSLKDVLWSVRHGLKQKYTVKAYLSTMLDLCGNVTIINVLSALAGLITIIYVNTVSKPWFLTNLQGFAVCYSALQLMSPTTFATGSLILGALFCYDIWAVFFTPLMVTVAKNLDQPIKLVFPRPDEPSHTAGEPPVKSFSMLGLGDIVLPGIMIGLALRFDLYMFYLRKQKKTNRATTDSSGHETAQEVVERATYVSVTGHWGDRFWTSFLPAASLPAQLKSSFPKPYFTASLVGYVVGMLTTLGVMSVFQHAQPALLYLVPGVLVSLWGTAVVRREVKVIWEFSEAVTAQPDADSEGKDNVGGSKEGGKDAKCHEGLFERLWTEIWGGVGEKNDQGAADGTSGKSSEADKSKNVEQESKTDNKAENDNSLLLSFSIARYDPTRSTKVKVETVHSNVQTQGRASPAGSESSDEAVVVSSADLDGAKESDEPRYDPRSMRASPTAMRPRVA